METKTQLEKDLLAAQEALSAAKDVVTGIQAKLGALYEQERKAEKKAHSGTRIEEYQTHDGAVFVIARGSYLESPKFFQMYVDSTPYFSKPRFGGMGAWGAHKFKTREEAEKELVEIRAAEKAI